MKMMRYVLAAALSLIAGMTAVGQETMTFAYASKTAKVTPVGSMRVDTYDVAIALTNPSVYGMAITSIDVPVFPSADVTGLSAWISDNLRLEQQGSVKVNVPDISFPLEMPSGTGVQWVTVDLPEPYVIPEGGTYVGYSFTVDKVDNTDATKYPVVATTGIEAGSLYLHTTRTYKQWADQTSAMNAISMLQVTLQGNTIPTNAVRLGKIPEKYVPVNTENSIGLMVYNVGRAPISKLDYITEAGGKSLTLTKVLDTPIEATFGYGEEVEFTFPAITSEGESNVTLTITGVNGQACSPVTASGIVPVALFVPKHNAVVEEYTGMWCGNCPRGFAAMEEMGKEYPGFIGIAYHNEDNLAMETGDPGMAEGYPMALIDRKLACDPYYADPASSTFSLPQVWQGFCDEFAPVEVSVTADWKEDTRTVVATSTVNWAVIPPDVERSNYRVEYVLVADGLYDPRWYQANYYADGSKGYPEYMDEFTHAGEKVYGLVYNDVAILASGFRGVKESIPSIALGSPTTHTYTFETDNAYNVYGKLIPFNKEHLRVVAMVLRGPGSGLVVNAGQCDVVVESGISAVAADATAVSVEYYDLNGRRISHPSGFFIKVQHMADGSVKRSKEFR